jgi:RNA polymerase sigma factor (sigma-70 family)
MEKLLRKIAKSFSLSTGMDYEDFYQEAYIAYLEAMKTHNPERGAVTTHIWWCVTNHLKNYLKEQEKEKVYSIDDIQCDKPSPASFSLDVLSGEAQEIAKVILESPVDFDLLDRYEVKKKIKAVLLNQGWSMKKIFSGFRELQSVYSN